MKAVLVKKGRECETVKPVNLEVAGEIVEDGDILLHPLGARPPVPRHRRVPLRGVERCHATINH